MTEEKKQQVYTLLILRKDDNHIEVVQSLNYDEVMEAYNRVRLQWATCIKDQTPFELMRPIVTTFDPGLIYEITVRPLAETTVSRFENPYQQSMMKNGFSSMFNKQNQVTTTGDLLDNGYR